MKFYYEPEDRIIESDEMVARFGTEFQIYELGIYPSLSNLTTSPSHSTTWVTGSTILWSPMLR